MANPSPKEHVEEIRRNKFSIGGNQNPLILELHEAVKNLSAELYAKDVHFLMELIQNLFEKEGVFVWYPQQSLPSLDRNKLLDIYKEIGVCTISKFVEKEESFQLDGADFKEVEPSSVFNGKGLVKLILGFLGCSSLKMEAEKRHKAVQGLLGLKVYVMNKPITISYNLSLSSGRTITKKANRMIRWESSKLFIQKMNRKAGAANMMKYATYFSEAICVGILCENVDHVGALSELIKFGFLLKFNEEAVDFLMESKDLQIFLEDEELLNDAFPSK